MPKIREYPEASQANSDDALILDSEEGTKYIRASNLLGPLSLSSTVDRATASGSVVHFEDGGDNAPMKDVLVHIEPVQAGSGDPSPDNVRPITGWTAAKVTRCGKNLLPVTVDGIKAMNPSVTWNGNSCIYNGVTITIQTDNSNNVIGLNFNGTANPYFYFNVTPNFAIDGSFIISPLPQGASYSNAFYGRILYEDGTDTGFLSNERSITKQNVNGSMQIVVATGSTVNFTYRPMLRLSSDTDSSYEPYHADTYNITFPSEAGTVYGGTLDVTQGVLTVDRAGFTLTGNEAWFKANTINSHWRFGVLNNQIATTPNRDAISNVYKSLTPNETYEGKMGVSQNSVSNALFVCDERYETVEDFKTYFATAGVFVSYTLTTPITYHLTPQEITSLLGENNLWADTGDTEVEYRADTKLYIDRKVAELQALILENEGN